MRIEAMLDDEQARKLEYLRTVTGSTLSDVVKTAIEHYHAEVAAAPVRAADALIQTGFIGCSEGDPDLSASYKQHLPDSDGSKHGHR